MARRYRRKKNKAVSIFLTFILLFLLGVLCYKIYIDQFSHKVKKDDSFINKVGNK